MRGENLLNVYFQNKVIEYFEKEKAFTETSAVYFSKFKGLNFIYLKRKKVVREFQGKYYLDEVKKDMLVKKRISRGFWI